MPKTNSRPPFGYKHGENGFYEIVEPSAAIVRRIYNEYLKQTTVRQIARNLNEDGIKSPKGVNWDHSTTSYVLNNIKYCGNENYEGIISKDLFQKVQELRERGFDKFIAPEDKEDVWKHIYPFTSIIICGQCGEKYTRAVNSSGRRCETRIWRCKTYVKGGIAKCNNTNIPEKQLKELFVRAFNRLQIYKTQYLNVSKSSNKANADNRELEILFDESIRMLKEASINKSDNINEVKRSVIIILQKMMERLWSKTRFDEAYYNNLKLQEILIKTPDILKEFNPDIFRKTVKKIIALEPGVVQFYFINGSMIEEYYETKAVMERRQANGKKECSGDSSKAYTRG